MSVKKKMLFDKGDRIQWTVSSTGYLSQSGQLTINEDTTINVNLVRPKIVFSWDGGGTKTVYFGSKKVTSTSPIYLGNNGPMTYLPDPGADFSNDSTTSNVFIDAEGLTDYGSSTLYGIFNDDTNVIENIEIINSSHLTNFGGAFSNMKYLRTVSIDTSGAKDIHQMFYKSAITIVPPLDTHNVTNIEYCFSGCTKLKSVPLLDFSNVTSAKYIFQGCISLTDVGGFIGLKTNIDFYDSPLTHASALNVIDNLDNVPASDERRIIFDSQTFNTLTPADIAKATSKGWTIEGL